MMMRPERPSHPLRRLVIGLAGVVALGGCKKCKEGPPPCNPDEEAFEGISVVIQPTDNLNPDAEGNALSVQFRVYQLKGDESLDLIDFEKVWHEGGKVAFGDDYLSEEEITVYPGRPDTIPLKPEDGVTFIVGAAIFGEPIGQDWFRVWEVPKYHGYSVCNAKKKKQDWPDPCFYVMLDRYQMDGGHTPPAGWDDTKMGDIACPGAPMTTPPPKSAPEEEGKKKKKGKKASLDDAKKAQEGAEKAQDVKAPEAPEAPGG